MPDSKYLYFNLPPEDLFRTGNASGPKISNARIPKDITVVEISGISHIIADNRGISLSSKDIYINDKYVWVLEKGTDLGPNLRLVNDHDDHFMIIPRVTMPLSTYKSCLDQLALKCKRIR